MMKSIRRGARIVFLAPLALALVAASACGDDPLGTDDDPADSVVAVRLQIGNTTVTVNEGGVVSGGPAQIGAGATAIAAAFIDSQGNAVAGLGEFELRVTPANAALLTFARNGQFTGTLNRVAPGSTTLSVQLFHTGEGHADFEVTLPISVS